jgi:hypothetical protein
MTRNSVELICSGETKSFRNNRPFNQHCFQYCNFSFNSAKAKGALIRNRVSEEPSKEPDCEQHQPIASVMIRPRLAQPNSPNARLIRNLKRQQLIMLMQLRMIPLFI